MLYPNIFSTNFKYVLTLKDTEIVLRYYIMRGRSPHNKPSVRKKEAYELLLKLDGEARWKDLKANLKELGWGPTTLKQTLDQLVEEKTIIREARLGTKGAEVWYRITTEMDLLKPTIVWKPSIMLEAWIAQIRENVQQLDGKEREIFLRDHLHQIVYASMKFLVGHFLLTLRNAEVRRLNESETLLAFDYHFDYLVKQPDKLVLQFLLEYREYAMEVLDQIMREPYKTPSVPRRSMKQFVESKTSAKKWIKSYANTSTS
jgi:DNA-binding HxlR family transcriptional regulator